MRTREEQISALRNQIFTVDCFTSLTEAHAAAEAHILEAERRAEQRVRAEIGRDSERLDWLGCSLVSLVIMKARSKRHILNVKLSGPLPALSFRKAIDAAREVG
ncbi:hypothetical protein K6W36_12205 [Acetobacter senegalensis]|uniref:hypothetical protein n=1 Tax=Acetobacter senegalensis TaxID=446692 RepID=UPI001EDADC46|nr:hypothetical protein [Acetobacter senegalensis]MCG4261327.1 hypothetical protein [Acetobacter senegalensis]